jgi:hypothetical protein
MQWGSRDSGPVDEMKSNRGRKAVGQWVTGTLKQWDIDH